MTDRLHNLIKHIGHSGKKIIAYCWVMLPVYRYTARVWAAKKSGPRDLDQILFELLQNGVTTRRQLAECLGIDDDSFIFTHLDILMREEYVVERDGRYALTNHGKEFADGNFMEESFHSEEFVFLWDEIREIAVDAPRKPNGRDGKKEQIKCIKPQGGLNQEESLSALASRFNAEKHAQSLEYHSIDTSYRIKCQKIDVKHVAVFYKSNLHTNDAWHVELRKLDDDGELELCRNLTKAANDHDKPWRNKFDAILSEINAN